LTLTKIDRWFLVQIEEIVKIELELEKLALKKARHALSLIDDDAAWPEEKGLFRPPPGQAAQDHRQGRARRPPCPGRAPGVQARGHLRGRVRHQHRLHVLHLRGRVRCAEPTTNKKIMVLGGGPNRIGQGIEFDYCCVHAALAMREDGYETIMVNCNPETVSTDYDTSDRLYFEPLTLEDVLEIVDKEKPTGVIVQYGGQTPLKLALGLEANGVPIIGTSPDMIDAAEDRERFQKLLHELNLRQPPNATARTEPRRWKRPRAGLPAGGAPQLCAGWPRHGNRARAARPGALHARSRQGQQRLPVLLDRFLNDAIECDVDCLRDPEGQTFIGGVMEHIEQAGVHSGDSACSLPPYSLSAATVAESSARRQGHGRCAERGGPDERAVRHPEHRRQGRDLRAGSEPPRLSRTVPFVSKATGIQLAKVAARCMAGQTLASQGITGSDTAVLQRQGSGVPVRQVPRCGHHPRPRDEVHRRGDGRGQDLWRGVCEEPAGRRHQAAARSRPTAPQRQGVPRSSNSDKAACSGSGPPAGGHGL
jgi:carbamoyl-phosphate synthase large subunit